MLTRGGLLAVLLGAGLPVALSAQKFEGVLTVHVGNMPSGARMQYFIKGNRYRLEMAAEGRPPIIMISDAPGKRQLLLFEEEHTYSEQTYAQLEKVGDSVRKKGMEILRGGVMTPAGGNSTVAGLRCTLHSYRDAKSVLEICLTTELGTISGTGGLFGSVTPIVESVAPPAWVTKLLKTGAFALKVADSSGTVLWEVLSVERKALDDALFAPPADYKPITAAPPPAADHA